MNKQQLEATVLAAIDQLRNGAALEDDRIELKRDWPTLAKARQLAAGANRARGDYLIYIIGIDESTGQVHPLTEVDPADWWPQISAQFDEVAPDLAHHLNIFISPGEAVAALLFQTDRAPYVVKIANGSAEREVPIRAGTRTRSAFRHELIRMFAPAAFLPPATLLDASLSGQWLNPKEAAPPRQGRAEGTYLHGAASVFVEHIGRSGIFLPAHEMRCEVVAGEWRIPLAVDLWASSKEARVPEPFGVELRNDGVAVTGPGRFAVRFSASLSGDRRRDFEAWRCGPCTYAWE